MNSKEYFDIYINAQKATGMQFVIFGILLFSAAVLLHFSQMNPITHGIRNGFIVISILLVSSGLVFIKNQDSLLKKNTSQYLSNPSEFEKQEVSRMQDVNKSVPKITISLSIVIIVLLLTSIFLEPGGFWQGVIFSILIYLLGLLILESISFLSVKNYLQALLNK